MNSFHFAVILVVLILLPNGNSYNPSICEDQPTQTGPCRAFFQMWRYLRKSQSCESFIYGGCMATRNIFDTEAECRMTCLA